MNFDTPIKDWTDKNRISKLNVLDDDDELISLPNYLTDYFGIDTIEDLLTGISKENMQEISKKIKNDSTKAFYRKWEAAIDEVISLKVSHEEGNNVLRNLHNSNSEILNIDKKDEHITLLVRLPQSGKTGIMLEDVNSFINLQSNKDVIPIAVVVCDNNSILVTQTDNRSKTINIKKGKISCKAKIIDDDVYKNVSGENSNKDSLIISIQKQNTNTVFMCGNKKRFEDIDKIISDLNIISPGKYRFKIFIDEADKLLSKHVKILINKWWQINNVMGIMIITATVYTPQQSFKKLKKWVGTDLKGEIKLERLNEIHGKNYHKLSECNLEIYEDSINKDPCEYMESYFENNELPKNGDVYMIPGRVKQDTHEDVVESCKELYDGEPLFNCIMILNGKTKRIEIYNYKSQEWDVIKVDEQEGYKNEEIKTWLAEIYKKYDGKKKFKMAITGKICISRGLTFSSEDCYITHMIFSPEITTNICDKYQLACRVCGYSLEYRKEVIFICNQETWDCLIKYENVTEKLCKMALKQHENDNEDIVITEDVIDELIQEEYYTDKNSNIEHFERDTFYEIQELAANHKDSHNFANVTNNTVENTIENTHKYDEESGFWLTRFRYGTSGEAQIRSYDNVIRDLSDGISSKCKWRMFVCYKDLQDRNSIVWIAAHYNSSL